MRELAVNSHGEHKKCMQDFWRNNLENCHLQDGRRYEGIILKLTGQKGLIRDESRIINRL
jgi:hypothetical protein